LSAFSFGILFEKLLRRKQFFKCIKTAFDK